MGHKQDLQCLFNFAMVCFLELRETGPPGAHKPVHLSIRKEFHSAIISC
jgi:hypothetical protein